MLYVDATAQVLGRSDAPSRPSPGPGKDRHRQLGATRWMYGPNYKPAVR